MNAARTRRPARKPVLDSAELGVTIETQRRQLFKASAVVDMCRYACASKFDGFDPEQMADALQAVYDLIGTVAGVLEQFAGDEADDDGGAP